MVGRLSQALRSSMPLEKAIPSALKGLAPGGESNEEVEVVVKVASAVRSSGRRIRLRPLMSQVHQALTRTRREARSSTSAWIRQAHTAAVSNTSTTTLKLPLPPDIERCTRSRGLQPRGPRGDARQGPTGAHARQDFTAGELVGYIGVGRF